ncbi:TetR/AcrR family transcriptional regulator [Peptoniphilus stercorisuis]|uniref:AcrR family transcriptional regulator n=1 Tax=Peptoniphilus stercorisuis TaxID=1436965 RepID=A0ABS4KEK6_9FIRM|nr:TetR/AcrR family transcriptional regulator [Peptoniphilus stercorisuis]MBP2025701.1 AcrR family transcriptional regulator [Peptoniphilus stercorisuis]
MKKLDISEDDLINIGINMAQREGLSNITIRSFAKEADVSVGTVYQFFKDKNTLINKIMNSYWKETLNLEVENIIENSRDFLESLDEIYSLIYKKSLEFHDFSLNYLMSSKSKPSDNTMDLKLFALKNKLEKLLNKDINVKEKINLITTDDEFLDFIIDNILSQIKRRNSNLGFFRKTLEIILN